MTRVAILVLLVTLGSAAPAMAQTPAPATIVHTRVSGSDGTVLGTQSVRLFVPHGAVPAGATVALGVGGVAGPGGTLDPTGVIVTASEDMQTPAVVLTKVGTIESAALAAGTPALMDTADRSLSPCSVAEGWVACVVPHAGAFVLSGQTAQPSADPLFLEAIAAVRESSGAGSRFRTAALAGAVGVAAAAAVWLALGRSPEKSASRDG